MSESVPYDGMAEVYDAWVESVPITAEMRSFYVELMSEADDPVVELGVGNGRICVEVARRGRRVVGVDSSTAMLDLCRRRAAEANVTERLDLVRADFRDFALERPASLIVLPFHSIGHLPTDADKRSCMEQVRRQLVPGGRFVWDHFVFDPDYPVPPGSLNLRADLRDADGRARLVWEASTHRAELQMIDVLVRIEELDADGLLEATRHLRIGMSWLEPERSRELLRASGFEIEALWGDFRRGPFEAGSSHQVWSARRGDD